MSDESTKCPTCPKCGEETGTKGSYGFMIWGCGTAEQFGGELDQSEVCRIRELEAKVDRLEKALAGAVAGEREKYAKACEDYLNDTEAWDGYGVCEVLETLAYKFRNQGATP